MVLEKQNRGDTWKEMLGAQVETHSWEEVLHDRGHTSEALWPWATR